jgi:hypothetical protein
MHPSVVANATANRRRTITLTNRPPIRILEDAWPVIAQGMCGSDDAPGAPYSKSKWSIEIRVRKDKVGRTIIHANYNFDDPQHPPEKSQLVRVGRYLPIGADLTPNILAVGEELRERIDNQNMRKFVTSAVDACFARLPPVEV